MQKKFLDRYGRTVLKGFTSTRSIKSNANSELLEYSSRSKNSSMKKFYQASEDFETGKFLYPEKPVVGYFCSLVPEELILACNLHPVRLCCEENFWTQAGEEIIPGDVCPVVKSICGKFYNQMYDRFDLVVVPGSCDPKTKLAELLSPLKEVYFLDPGRDCEYLKNADIWEEKYTKFFDFLKERFHCSSGRKHLLSACKKTNARTEIFRKIYQFRTRNPEAINSFDYYIMIYASFFMDIEIWNNLAENVYREALETREICKNPKILLAGTPVIFPNFKIIDVIEQAGLSLAADIQCTTFGRFYNPVEIDEDTDSGIIRALSLKDIAGSICPCLLNLEKLVNLIVDAVSQYNLDGVIYYNLRLCQVFDIQTAVIRQALKEKDIPFISIKTDLGNQDTGQLKTRLEAFREMIESHRK
ncbi:MAG: 2-hydroxyacyl-CoA dehydratase family protein [Candidatus Omnitrophica bacterium]|nr:2-hydroxyacyl-CoA dehydratase family protein [Candidatus Omnitrophota bacterium]